MTTTPAATTGSPTFLKRLMGMSLVAQIAIGLVLGIAFALAVPNATASVGMLGQLFVSALKAVAPILVFLLVMTAIANHKQGETTHIRPVLVLYVIGTLTAAAVAVTASFLFPTTLVLDVAAQSADAPTGIVAVLQNLLLTVVSNPVKALAEGNFLSILAWASGIGFLLRRGGEGTRAVLTDFADAISAIVHVVIRFAPVGIFGLVASTLGSTGFDALLGYGQLLLVIVGCILFVALIVNPLIVFWKLRTNPYPLVFTCLRDSGVTAFFTRSSAANIPINLELSKRLGVHEDTYSIAIPLGATINMAGAAITISVMTLAAAHTLGIPITILQALLLCIVSGLAAAGASGVAGGSLLLIPMACALFGIDADVAMQVVAIGFVISVVQDSMETALNSSTDVLFTAAASSAATGEPLRLDRAK